MELKGLFLEPKNWVECFGLVFRIFQLGNILQACWNSTVISLMGENGWTSIVSVDISEG